MTPLQTFGANAAPSNMQFPTAAYLQASQNAADMRLKGDAALGAGIAQGISGAVGEYTKFRDMKSQVNAAQKSYETLKSFLPKEVVGQIDAQIESMDQDPNLSLRDKAAFWTQTKGTLGSLMGQGFELDKQQRQLDAAAKRQREMLDEQAMEPFRRQAATLLNNPMAGTDFGVGQRLSAPPKQQRPNFFGDLQ